MSKESSRARQAELDRFARARRWSRGRFGSYKAFGFTIAVGATGYPRRKFVAAKGTASKEFDDLGALENYICHLATVGREPG